MEESQSIKAKRSRKISDLVGIILIIIFLPLLIPLGLCFLIYTLLLHLTIWGCYCTRGINVLFVHSNSPNWQQYLEEHIIPRLPQNCLRLNWSERSKWNQISLPVLIFRHFGGYKEFNPLGIVFRPFKKTKVFRFWKPFIDLKHGKTGPLKTLEADFIRELEAII